LAARSVPLRRRWRLARTAGRNGAKKPRRNGAVKIKLDLDYWPGPGSAANFENFANFNNLRPS
jgi:hypothetical protein